MTDIKSIEKMSFEETLAELEAIVKKIDSGQDGLAASIENFERGIMLKKHCETMLKNAKLKIEKITSFSEDAIQTSEAEL